MEMNKSDIAEVIENLSCFVSEDTDEAWDEFDNRPWAEVGEILLEQVGENSALDYLMYVLDTSTSTVGDAYDLLIEMEDNLMRKL